jgi:hypothetical protein
VARPKALFCLPHEFTQFEMPTFKAGFYCVLGRRRKGWEEASFQHGLFRSREELLNDFVRIWYSLSFSFQLLCINLHFMFIGYLGIVFFHKVWSNVS